MKRERQTEREIMAVWFIMFLMIFVTCYCVCFLCVLVFVSLPLGARLSSVIVDFLSCSPNFVFIYSEECQL